MGADQIIGNERSDSMHDSDADYINVQTQSYDTSRTNDLATAFPGAEVYGCHFYFCQAIFTNLNQLGYNLSEYEAITTDAATSLKVHSPLHTWVRRLVMPDAGSSPCCRCL